MYTSPDSIYSRRSGNWENVARVLNHLPQDEDLIERIRFKIFGLDTTKVVRAPEKDIYPVSPQKHGSFSGIKYWEQDTWR